MTFCTECLWFNKETSFCNSPDPCPKEKMFFGKPEITLLLWL